MSETVELAEKLKSEGEKFVSIFSALTEGQWQAEVYTEGETWTIRNVLSHFVTSERGLVKLFEQIRQGGGGVTDEFSIDRYNAGQQEKTKDLSPAELLEQYKFVRANSVVWVSGLKDEELEIKGHHPFLGQTTIREMIKMLYLHNQIHYRDLKKVLKYTETGKHVYTEKRKHVDTEHVTRITQHGSHNTDHATYHPVAQRSGRNTFHPSSFPMNLPPFKLERYFAKYEFNTEYLLCSSDCEAMSIADLLAFEPAADEKFGQTWLGYTESQGDPKLRQAICGLYETIQPEQVLVHAGAEEAIFLFMHAMLASGDHIIVHSPCYQSLTDVARAIGCEVSPWMAREENNWALDLDELRRLVRPNTKLIVVNTPHNPTGYLMPRADFDSLHRFVQENNLLLFSDEVYRESEYDPAARLPAACDQGEYAVSLGVTSKTYGLAGLRIGWIATRNKNIYARMAALKDYTTICNSAPSEFLAALALRHRRKLIDRNLGIIKHNLSIVDNLFTRYSELFTWTRPQAGSMGFPRLLKGDVEEFCDSLVKGAGVLLLPGSMYDDTGNHFRLGLGRKNLPEAVARLEGYVNA